MEIIILKIVSGVVVGLFLGLTGSGGSVLAVPLLVYVLKLSPHQGVCASMIMIGIISMIGSLVNLVKGKVVIGIALLTAVAGILGAPVGAWISRYLSEAWLLLLFSGFVLTVSLHLLVHQRDFSETKGCDQETVKRWNSPVFSEWTPMMGIIGFGTGVLSGLLGIGGGLILVPSLMIFSKLKVHQAITTSLFIVALISISAVSAHLSMGQNIPIKTTVLFTAGGLSGLGLGSLISKYIPIMAIALTASFQIKAADPNPTVVNNAFRSYDENVVNKIGVQWSRIMADRFYGEYAGKVEVAFRILESGKLADIKIK